MNNCPVLYLIYNRLDVTMKSFESIRLYRPSRIFIAADGPKDLEDEILTTQCRKYVLDNIDWPCQIEIKFEPKNKGCGKNVSQAIDWFFEQVDYGIILEDDIIAKISFFRFCEILLADYQSNREIFSITGVNWQNGIPRGKCSYYFSRYPGIWGWATWKDRWEHYKFQIQDLEEFKESRKIKKIAFDKPEINYHIKSFEDSITVDTWDFQWKYVCFKNMSYCIVPNENLISNIGFGQNATHTKNKDWRYNRDSKEIIEPLKHPKSIKRHIPADKFFSRHVLPIKRISLLQRIKRKLVHIYEFIEK